MDILVHSLAYSMSFAKVMALFLASNMPYRHNSSKNICNQKGSVAVLHSKQFKTCK